MLKKGCIWSAWFGNILSIPSVLSIHDLTTYASCVTMQMRHVCIIRGLIWIFFEFNADYHRLISRSWVQLSVLLHIQRNALIVLPELVIVVV